MKQSPSAFAAEHCFRTLQDSITRELERSDGRNSFVEELWELAPAAEGNSRAGGGRTRILEGGAVYEKAGVNFSAVHSDLSPRLAERLGAVPQTVYATGISLVLHPRSPMVPTVHMNLRYLELENGEAWFGGGTDLTPYYLFRDDAVHFHTALRSLCDQFDASWYPRFKRQCDEYFYLPHRAEARGIGGIFFDNCRDSLENFFRFVRLCGERFPGIYLPIVERRKADAWGEREKRWQEIRRGRYVEFNLLHDRGTLFGLETGGRTASILMSLPPAARWQYQDPFPEGDRERELLEVLRHPKEWA